MIIKFIIANKSPILKYIGYILTVFSFYFIYQLLQKNDLSAVFSQLTIRHWLYFTILVFLSSFTVLFSAYCWKLVLEFVSNKKINITQILKIYVQTNIAKYLPGNVLHYVGRNIIGVKLGWTHRQMAFSTILETILLILLPFLLFFLFFVCGLFVLPPKIEFTVSDVFIWIIIFTILIILLIFGLYIHTRKYKNLKLQAYFDSLFFYLNEFGSIKFGYLLIKFFGIITVSFCYGGLIFYANSLILGIDLGWQNFITITSVLSIAGYSGILTPGVPGGIGVKESVAVVLLSTYGYNEASLIVVLLASRITSLLGDIVSYFYSYLFKDMNKNSNYQTM